MLRFSVLFLTAVAYAASNTANLMAPSTRVVGGHDAPQDKYTYTVSIRDSNGQKCTGSILCDKYVLTAAHCCQDPPNYRDAYVGSHDRTQGGVQHLIEKWIVHEAYGGLGAGGLLNDICIAVLTDKITFNQYTTQTVLPMPPAAVTDGTSSIVMGWGYDDRNATDVPKWLQYDTGFTAYSTEFCAENAAPGSASITPFDGQLCVIGKEGETVCAGDSGGPLVTEVNGQDVQIGTFSYYFGSCGTPYPDIYTNVSHYVPWIKSKVDDPTCIKFASLTDGPKK